MQVKAHVKTDKIGINEIRDVGDFGAAEKAQKYNAQM